MPRQPWRGLAVALVLLLAVEACLHTDSVLHRYRSVFAAGRAMDKALYAQAHCPSLLVLGNSRADNGFDPRTLVRELRLSMAGGAFNLGVPGADSRVLAGILGRLDRAGCLSARRSGHLVLVLDEALVQAVDTLGQQVFFAGIGSLLQDGQYHDALRAGLRLYGYTDNLRGLREPASLQRFARATLHDTDPLGGGAALHLGYRAGFGGLQNQAAAQQQELGSRAPPDAVNLRQLWRMLDLLQLRGVNVAVVFPPVLGRELLYRGGPTAARAPYQAVVDELTRRGVPMIALDEAAARDPAEFVNPGHLNDLGAQRYSRLLAQALNRTWQTAARPAMGPKSAPSAPS